MNNLSEDILIKVLIGEASVQEMNMVQDWLAQSPENNKTYHDLKAIWDKSEVLKNESSPDVDEAWQNFKKLTNDNKVAFKPRNWWTAAAAVLVISLAGWWFLPKENTITTVASTASVVTDTLSDGSVITLNKNSSFTYQDSKSQRKLGLKGEAFFNIKRDENKPFVIESGNATITVLGTSFNVKNTKNTTEIVVETGLVKVQNKNQTAQVMPGEKVVSTNLELKKTTINDEFYNYYRTQKIVCRQTRLSELIPVLNEIYQVNIVADNQHILNKEITTVFDKKNINEVLEVLKVTLDLNVTNEQNKIILK